jgi:hypothetical protein
MATQLRHRGMLLGVKGVRLLAYWWKAAMQASIKVGYAWHDAICSIDLDDGVKPRPVFCVRSWQTGIGLFALGNVLQFFSFAFASQSLLLALSSLQFATQLVFAWAVEGQRVAIRSMIAAGIIIGANMLLVVFSSKSSALLRAPQIVVLHRCGPSWEAVLSLVCYPTPPACPLYCGGSSRPSSQAHPRPDPPRCGYRSPRYITYMVIGAVVSIGCTAVYILLNRRPIPRRLTWLAPLQPVTLAIAAAIPATQSLIYSKAVAMMMLVTLGQRTQLRHWFFWVAVGVSLCGSGTWMAVIQHGIASFPTVIILPILQVHTPPAHPHRHGCKPVLSSVPT